jgi:hypothetical protein
MAAAEDRDELRNELTQLDADILAARQNLDRIRQYRADASELPDTSDDATLIRAFEDQETILASLEARRADVVTELG